MFRISILYMFLKITHLRLQAHLPRVNELRLWFRAERRRAFIPVSDDVVLHCKYPSPGQDESRRLNSLVPGWCACKLKLAVFEHILKIAVLSISCEIVLRWMPQDLIDVYSTSVQVMAWCLIAPSHHLSQYWLRSMSPYSITSHSELIQDVKVTS